jgi:hypothetical protein
MNRFVTRVELQGATAQDYENLHAFMAQENFSRLIQSDDGRWFHLPTATYHSWCDGSADDVRFLADRAAARTGRGSWVLVVEAERISWRLEQLKPVSPLTLALLGI